MYEGHAYNVDTCLVIFGQISMKSPTIEMNTKVIIHFFFMFYLYELYLSIIMRCYDKEPPMCNM